MQVSADMSTTSPPSNPDNMTDHYDNKSQQEETSDEELALLDDSDKHSPPTCLFCSKESKDIFTNVLHMRKTHGLLVPAQEQLIVDMESLLGYLHVIIFDLKECIFCHTVRRTPNAVQQHMMAKGHCRLDLESDKAEMLDFYDTSTADPSACDQQAYPGSQFETGRLDVTRATPMFSRTQSENPSSSLQLPGKTVLARGHQPVRPVKTSLSTSRSAQRPKTQVGKILQTRQDRVAEALENRLGNLRTNDRSSLVHLPRSEMFSILSTSQKQLSQAQKTERRIRSRLESKNNSTMMKHFKNDVPGPKNG